MKVISPFPKATYHKNAEVYKILANPIRLEILNILKYGEFPVKQLTNYFRLRKPNISQHLALLRHSQIVNVRRSGLTAYYSIVNPTIIEPCKILHNIRKKNNAKK